MRRARKETGKRCDCCRTRTESHMYPFPEDGKYRRLCKVCWEAEANADAIHAPSAEKELREAARHIGHAVDQLKAKAEGNMEHPARRYCHIALGAAETIGYVLYQIEHDPTCSSLSMGLADAEPTKPVELAEEGG